MDQTELMEEKGRRRLFTIIFCQVYEKEYNQLMRRKLGLLTESSDDAELFSKLFATMRETHSDFTTTFLLLQSFDLIGSRYRVFRREVIIFTFLEEKKI